jgi:hypothetical protein
MRGAISSPLSPSLSLSPSPLSPSPLSPPLPEARALQGQKNAMQECHASLARAAWHGARETMLCVFSLVVQTATFLAVC